MSLPKFTKIHSLSNKEISETILKVENKLFNLRFKKATRQNYNSHDVKYTKRLLAQLKTLLSIRLESSEQKEK